MCCTALQCQAKGHTLRAGHRADTRQTVRPHFSSSSFDIQCCCLGLGQSTNIFVSSCGAPAEHKACFLFTDIPSFAFAQCCCCQTKAPLIKRRSPLPHCPFDLLELREGRRVSVSGEKVAKGQETGEHAMAMKGSVMPSWPLNLDLSCEVRWKVPSSPSTVGWANTMRGSTRCRPEVVETIRKQGLLDSIRGNKYSCAAFNKWATRFFEFAGWCEFSERKWKGCSRADVKAFLDARRT